MDIINVLIPVAILYFFSKLVIGLALTPMRRYFPEGISLLRWCFKTLWKIPKSIFGGFLLADTMQQFKRRGWRFGFAYLIWKCLVLAAIMLAIVEAHTGGYFIPLAIVLLIVILGWHYLRSISWKRARRHRTRLPGRRRR